ncbi:helix-turn-helix domain-containing protein [Pediococcus argentinicus]|uniref:Helicase Helix-turn-helix domain-containing protein n=1 Tax=Pediococcus argentinicus TaxID=480391 RepID=A0A0R2NSR5_9LACO|nr:helix-turn-helix domain-containing protein [Pediococcus argentinicus]KRO26282.1 hypothetical protein IV88_GL000067 [Pediococcus argentinicus]NKZ21526.1 hypothetical protein [Pediococcus argentinicus]GEP18675.1 hypothetical protein LSA03_00590 [Pediococcus argentinicus]
MITIRAIRFFDLKQARRPKIISNLLRGKQTVSTLFWGLQYNLLNWLSFDLGFNEQDFLRTLSKSVNKGYLTVKDDEYLLTPLGSQLIASVSTVVPSGFQAQLNQYLWRSSLTLAIQIISQYQHQNNKYIPIQADEQTTFIVKKWFIKNKNADIITTFKDELIQVGNQLSHDDANLFFNLLVGYNEDGLTTDQFSKILMIEPWIIEERINIIFSRIGQIVKDSNLSLLNQLLLSTLSNTKLTHSAELTWQLISNQNRTVAEIANMRRIKTGTVQEHILMSVILVSDFNYHPENITEDIIKDVQALEIAPSQWSIEDFNAKYGNLSFFEFRLLQITETQRRRLND